MTDTISAHDILAQILEEVIPRFGILARNEIDEEGAHWLCAALHEAEFRATGQEE